eukprot:scaffold20728_cov132-Isochrysis_galbana.AAC.15
MAPTCAHLRHPVRRCMYTHTPTLTTRLLRICLWYAKPFVNPVGSYSTAPPVSRLVGATEPRRTMLQLLLCF